MTMDLDALRAFVQVAELASFTQAGERLGLPKGRVSAVVQQLEAGLGTRLLHRTTRVVRLTPDGELFLERCRELLAEADELQAFFQRSPGALRGRLRVDLSVAIARRFVIPRLPEFLAVHPQLEIELSSTDRRVDLVHEGFDCVLRIGSLDDSGLVARRLGELVQLNCASPAYLRAHGTPRSLEELSRHRVVRYAPAMGAAATGFEYHDGERWRTWPMASCITVNNTDAYQAACLAGLGLIQAPALGMEALLERGELVEVLPQLRGPALPVSLIYPARRNLPRRVQAFMAWLETILQPALQ
ncbi:MAG: LysR family transcriptional regulator [Aquabacterium sp.]|nr:MAG: LysR family transcriptional regulator [Aquabacterium sp.]